MLGKKNHGERDSLREAGVWPIKKMHFAFALVARGKPVKWVCELLGVAQPNMVVRLTRAPDWCDGRKARTSQGSGPLKAIQRYIDRLSSYGDRRDQRWCSDGFEFRCDDTSPLRVNFALDCCDREAMSWTMTTAGHSGDAALAALEHRFGGTDRAPSEIEWLTDNGSAYITARTRAFAQKYGLNPVTTPVRSPQSNGMAGSFVKTIKRDYVAFMSKSDVPTAMQNLVIAFKHYNGRHPQCTEIPLPRGLSSIWNDRTKGDRVYGNAEANSWVFGVTHILFSRFG